MPPLKPCPNPDCGKLIQDWHTEWMTDDDRALVNSGQAGVDCPECGAFIMIPHHVVTGVAPDTAKRAKRSRKKAEAWAKTLSRKGGEVDVVGWVKPTDLQARQGLPVVGFTHPTTVRPGLWNRLLVLQDLDGVEFAHGSSGHELDRPGLPFHRRGDVAGLGVDR